MWEKIKSFVSEHPWGTAGIVFVVGVILIYLFWPRSSAASSPDTGLGSYYNAQAAAVQSGAAVYGQQIQANAATTAANDQLQATLASIAASQNVSTTQTNDQLAAIQAETSAALQASLAGTKAGVDYAGILAKNNVDLANISASVANNSTAAALQYGTAQINEQGHAVDVAGQTVQQQQQLTYQLGQDVSSRNTQVQLADVQTQQALDTYNYLAATHAQDIQAVANSYNYNTANAALSYNYLTNQQKITAAQNINQQNITGAVTLANLGASLASGGKIYGTWSPVTGQVTSNASTVGGPIDPAVIAQLLQYPQLFQGQQL